MDSMKKGTNPKETGGGIRLAGSLSVEEFGALLQDSKRSAWIAVRHDGHELDLFLTAAQIRRLKKMIEGPGFGFAKKGDLASGQHRFHINLDLSLGGISVEVTPPMEDDCAFCYLGLKDRHGNEAIIDLSLDLARELRTKLDAFFAAELARQEAQLA